jgi:hypothetical protein
MHVTFHNIGFVDPYRSESFEGSSETHHWHIATKMKTHDLSLSFQTSWPNLECRPSVCIIVPDHHIDWMVIYTVITTRERNQFIRRTNFGGKGLKAKFALIQDLDFYLLPEDQGVRTQFYFFFL